MTKPKAASPAVLTGCVLVSARRMNLWLKVLVEHAECPASKAGRRCPPCKRGLASVLDDVRAALSETCGERS